MLDGHYIEPGGQPLPHIRSLYAFSREYVFTLVYTKAASLLETVGVTLDR